MRRVIAALGSGVALACAGEGCDSGDLPARHDGKELIAFSIGGRVSVVPARGGPARSLAPGGQPTWSPDGKRIAFVAGRQSLRDLFVMDADGRHQRRLTFGDGSSSSPAWSPDGRLIAFQREHGETRSGIWVLDVATGDARPLPTLAPDGAPLDATDPAWSPDGARIVFSGSRRGDTDIYVVGADGGRATQVTRTTSAHETTPAWSPDGTRIALTAVSLDDEAVWTMRADGTSRRRVAADAEDPAWSPDGTRLAYVSVAAAGGPGLNVVRPDGSRRVGLTRRNAPAYAPAWRPLP